MHDLDTTGWNAFPFTADGVDYVSKIASDSPFMSRIAMLPEGVFNQMNISAVRDCVGSGLTRDEIIAKLNEVNQDASHAVIELA